MATLTVGAAIEEFEEQNHFIDIAWDRRNGKYIAYNSESHLFGEGVDVETAKLQYIHSVYEQLAQMAAEDHAEQQKV